jgi:hypothetical protein
MDCLILPLQDKVEDWKKSTVQLDKDHAKGKKSPYQQINDVIHLNKKIAASLSPPNLTITLH